MSVFKFKQFEVNQTGCAMKINTDGVLLAALADGNPNGDMLDIGTGTGVISLMLAQRFPKANIYAVEIDSEASATAKENFKNSVFKHRLSINNNAIEQFETDKRFDLIISNPPYFVNDLRNAEEKKGIARHAKEEFFTALLAKVNELLAPNGCFWFILPVKQATFLNSAAHQYGLRVSKQILVHSSQSKAAFRWIVCLNRFNNEAEIEHFYIYKSEKVYTEAYKSLLKDFFLGY